MATYSPSQLGIKPPDGGFKEGAWYQGRQYWGGTLSDPGVIHPSSNQQGAGQAVSKEVNAQSAAAQGISPQQLESYLEEQRRKTPQSSFKPGQYSGPEGGVGSGAGASSGAGFTQAAPLNLPKLYESLYDSSGIKDLEEQYSNQEKEFIEAKGKINDNPFLSEATRVGRVAKLEQLFGERTANIKNDIATKKADIETKLNLELKQFDINSQAAQQALSQFNTLLQMGALDNASGEDIANITRSTGISSQAIYSAINAKKQKDIDTQILTATADSGEVTAVVMNAKTGEVISKNSLGFIGNRQTSGGGASKEPSIGSGEYEARAVSAINQFISSRSNSYGHIGPEDWRSAMNAFLADALGTREEFVRNYAYYTDPHRGDFDQAYGFSRDIRTEITGF